MSKNYEEMSDFEINKSIAKLKYNHPKYPDYFKFYRLDEGSAVQVNAYKMWPQNLDFCNNPSDAWPVIIESEMKIDPRRSSPKLDWMVSRDDQIYAVDKNPLRAAMICFLKMKDNEQ